MNQPMPEGNAIDVERMRRAKSVWEDAKPSSFEVSVAEKRIRSRARARKAGWIGYLIVPAVVAAVCFVALWPRHPATPIGPVSERSEPPAIGRPAATVDAAARDTARLAAAEALHRSGQCRAAKPEIEDLAARGATPEIRAHARALLDEISRQPPP